MNDALFFAIVAVFLFIFGPESEKSSTDEGKRRRILDQPRAIAGPQVVYPLASPVILIFDLLRTYTIYVRTLRIICILNLHYPTLMYRIVSLLEVLRVHNAGPNCLSDLDYRIPFSIGMNEST